MLVEQKITQLTKDSTEIRALQQMNAEIRVQIGRRLCEERDRLALTQAELAEKGDAKSRTLQDWERGIAAPSSEFLARVSPLGLDVFYVLTGERMSVWFEKDPLRRAVLNSFDQCSPDKRIEAVQHMALLAAGVAQTPSGSAPTSNVTKAKVSKSIFGFAGNVVGKK
ncbi:MAG: helix-turn-helix transcriptional regulator [Rhodoferax sp.]